MRCGSGWNAFPLGANLLGPQNVCSTVLLGFYVCACVYACLCVCETEREEKSIFPYVSKDPRRLTVLVLPLSCCFGVFNPKIHTGVHFFNSSTTCNKGCPSLHHHQPPWITGFASIRAVLSWLKLYYWEIRERLGDGATDLPVGRAGELARIALGQPFAEQQKWLSV